MLAKVMRDGVRVRASLRRPELLERNHLRRQGRTQSKTRSSAGRRRPSARISRPTLLMIAALM